LNSNVLTSGTYLIGERPAPFIIGIPQQISLPRPT
jgi:hypothetical protein